MAACESLGCRREQAQEIEGKQENKKKCLVLVLREMEKTGETEEIEKNPFLGI
jgi:hypothetical protein